jgi:subtilisin family serine protease
MTNKFRMRVARASKNEPIFTLPPYKVEQVFSTYSETQDWGLKLMGIPNLWRLTKGSGTKVAILDTGIATAHPDLKDGILKTKNFTNSRVGVSDVAGHGTHCAGIIGARENATGVIGVAPECGFLIGKVLGDDGSGNLLSVARGIDWAVEQGADIINMSLGSPTGHPDLEAAINRAVAAGVFVICAAGNEGPTLDTVGYPAMYTGTVSVGAIDQNKKIANFSSRGTRVDVCAPGVDILSDYPPRNLAKLSGTSMASPFVAGVVALMVAKHREFGKEDPKPLKTAADLIAVLHGTSIDAGPAGFDPNYGFGIINPASLIPTKPAPVPPIGRTLTLTASDLTQSGQEKVKAFYGDLRDISIT